MSEKCRNWVMVLYPEDTTHLKCIDLLKSGGYQFCACLHDKDTDEDGNLKKPHWHVVLKFPRPRYPAPIAEELGVPVNYLEHCRNIDNALAYLVHEGHPDKYQYDLESVFGPLVPALAKLLIDETEDARVLNIVEMIDNSPGYCTYREILVKACKNGLYGEFRRLGSGVKYLLDEHNDEFIYSRNSRVFDGAEEFDRAKMSFRNLRFVEQCERMERLNIPVKSIR